MAGALRLFCWATLGESHPTMLVESHALVLRRHPFGDTSLVATLYTQQFGMCSVLAKGGRAPGSPHSAALEVPNHVRIAFYQSPRRQIFLVRMVEVVERFSRTRNSIEHAATALLMAESVLLTQAPGEPNAALYGLLLQALRKANESSHPPFSIAVAFLLRLARILGFALPLATAKAVEEERTYVLENGTFRPAEQHSGPGIPFTGTEIRLLAAMQALSLEIMSVPELQQELALKLIRKLIAYLEHHLERPLVLRSLKLWSVDLKG